jgi:hypothetical protein
MDVTEPFEWGVLGETRWKELQEATGASDLQMRFAAARFSGASATKAAKLAGYSGDSESIRRAGYTALRSSAVQNLLELAAVDAPGDAKITRKELAAKISKLCRSSDPLVSLKAIEAFQKFESAEKASGESPDDDGLGPWRIERDFLMQSNGATAYVLMHLDGALMGNIANLNLLHDTHALLMQQRFGPELWEICRNRLNDNLRELLDKRLADKKWQLEARKKVWAEIGIRLDDNGKFNMAGLCCLRTRPEPAPLLLTAVFPNGLQV